MAKAITKPKKQLTFVVDLNKCIGCQTCTVACKRLWTTKAGEDHIYWRNVETRPGKGYPRNWIDKGGGFKGTEVQKGRMPTLGDYGVPFEFDYQSRLFEGNKERVRPRPNPTGAGFASWAPNWDEDQGAGDYPNNYYFYLPRHCNHCSRPACLEACPNDAIYKREQDGVVLVDPVKCKGSRNCVQACPYDKVYFNSAMQKATKCIACYPRIEKGIATACVAQCAGRAMHVGFIEDTNSSVHKLAKVWKVALPLYAEKGTEPNIFYVPPVLGPVQEDEQGNLRTAQKIPLEYLVKLFGNDVSRVLMTLRDERSKRMSNKPSDLMDVLIGLRSTDMMLSPLT
jgi:DMSO reductase family type II enzyme iron-sulfur subunit